MESLCWMETPPIRDFGSRAVRKKLVKTVQTKKARRFGAFGAFVCKIGSSTFHLSGQYTVLCVTMGTYLTNSQSKQEGPKPNFDVLPIVIPKWKVQLSPLSFRNPFHYFSSLLANVHGFVIMLVVPKSLYISHAWR